MFLMQQMELRESVESVRDAADPEAEIEQLQSEVDAQMRDLRGQFESYYQQATPSALEAAATVVRKMQFIDKLGREVEAWKINFLMINSLWHFCR